MICFYLHGERWLITAIITALWRPSASSYLPINHNQTPGAAVEQGIMGMKLTVDL